MPRKDDKKPLTLTDLEILNARTVEGKTVRQVSMEQGISESTVKRRMKHPDYRALAIAALDKAKMDIDRYAEKLSELTEAERGVNVNGLLEYIPDGSTQLGAIKEIGSILGVHAPKDVRITADMASQDDVGQEIDEALNALTSTPGAQDPLDAGEDSEAQSGESELDIREPRDGGTSPRVD